MLMSVWTADWEDAASTAGDLIPSRPRPLEILLLSAWCGLVSGLLEVGITVLRKQTFDINHLYWMSRHFVWLVPLTDLAIFALAGVPLSLLAWRGGRRGRWLAPRLLCTLTLLPPIWAASSRIFGPAGVLLALGAAWQLVPALERHAAGFRRLVRLGAPVAVAVLAVLAASPWVTDQIKERSEAARPLPPPGSANVLLLVLDTVAADHLGLYGYDRPTSPTIDELAARGIRFDRAQATSSWTLPSHASMFTGGWPHEISAGWITPLDGARPTLAEFLGSRGYATAGFTANYWYCAADSGLGRGFTVYRDYIFPQLTALRPAVLVHRPVNGLQSIGQFLGNRLGFDPLEPVVQQLGWLFHSGRKGAGTVNREFLDWLSRRRQPERPFFAFLNYFDAHHPYELPETGIHRFTVRTDDDREFDPGEGALQAFHRDESQSQIVRDRDTYDDCIAELDEELGRLIDQLQRRGILDRTWVIVVADHGESFGEHAGVFHHGTSLYQTELHVPLVIVPPAAGRPPSRVVTEPVSLRDLAATIVDGLGLRADSPFAGESLLARAANGPARPSPADPEAGDRALAEVVPLDGLNPDPAQLLELRWPMAALTDGDWKYIRREGEVREELFHSARDPREQHDLSGDPAMRPTLERMRRALDGLTAGPLTQHRFNP
jgi:arylsulfatase A-like enzyme